MSKKAAIPIKKQAIVKQSAAKKPVKRRKRKLTIMVSSTVFGNGKDLDQIAAILRQQYGYNVILSKEGSVYVSIKNVKDKKAACLAAVKKCDLFLGIIFLRYGSGITHDEFLEAKRLKKPSWFIAHEKVEFIRKLLQPKMYTIKGSRKKFDIPKTTVLDSIKVVDMYNDVREHWIHSDFNVFDDIMEFLKTQFSDMDKRIKEIEDLKKKKK